MFKPKYLLSQIKARKNFDYGTNTFICFIKKKSIVIDFTFKKKNGVSEFISIFL